MTDHGQQRTVQSLFSTMTRATVLCLLAVLAFTLLVTRGNATPPVALVHSSTTPAAPAPPSEMPDASAPTTTTGFVSALVATPAPPPEKPGASTRNIDDDDDDNEFARRLNLSLRSIFNKVKTSSPTASATPPYLLRPIVLVGHVCSGTAFATRVLKRVLGLAGIGTFEPDGATCELLVNDTCGVADAGTMEGGHMAGAAKPCAPFLAQAGHDLVEATRLLVEAARRAGKALVIHAEPRHLMVPGLSRALLKQFNATPVYVFRKTLLDVSSSTTNEAKSKLLSLISGSSISHGCSFSAALLRR